MNTKYETVLDAAVECARVGGVGALTRETIAKRAGMAPGLVPYYLGSMDNVRELVKQRAILRKIYEIVGYFILTDPNHSEYISLQLKGETFKYLGES